MALKTCPNCNTKCGPRKRICDNANCKYVFISSENDDDDDDDDDYEIPERNCSICGDKFRPAMTRKSISGQPYFVWQYNNYCSSGCFENGEEQLFNYIFDLIKNKLVENIPENILKIVNIDSFGLRTVDSTNINYASFLQLISPQKKHVPATVVIPSDFEKIEKPIITPEEFEEKFGRKPPKKVPDIDEDYPEDSLERQVADYTNLPLGDYLDHALDDPQISLDAKKSINANKKLKPGQKRCQNSDCGKIWGPRKATCDCGYNFPIKG